MLIEKCITETMVIRKLGLGLRHLPYLKSVGKTAAVSMVAGVVTYFVYVNLREYIAGAGEHFAQQAFSITKTGTLNFIGGAMVMAVSAVVFGPIYLLGTNLLGLIEDDDKRWVSGMLHRSMPKRGGEALADTRV
jgi:hypothetical protein